MGSRSATSFTIAPRGNSCSMNNALETSACATAMCCASSRKSPRDDMALQDLITVGGSSSETPAPAAPAPIRVSHADTQAAQDDRFHRFGLISWWDQRKLANARVLVVG